GLYHTSSQVTSFQDTSSQTLHTKVDSSQDVSSPDSLSHEHSIPRHFMPEYRSRATHFIPCHFIPCHFIPRHFIPDTLCQRQPISRTVQLARLTDWHRAVYRTWLPLWPPAEVRRSSDSKVTSTRSTEATTRRRHGDARNSKRVAGDVLLQQVRRPL
ncbi:unnamed protein product, partial [Ixodes hexagonus]